MSLKIFLLGQFKLQADERPFELPSRPAQSLLAFLAFNAGLSHRREKLSGLLWPDSTESNARGYLRQALWRIRKHFEAASLSWQAYLQISDIDVSFDAQSDYWLDARQFLRPVDSMPLNELIGVVQLYQDELLPGFYDDWILAERDRLRTAYSHRMNLLLERLIRLGRWEEVIRWAEEWITPDCSPESAFRAMLTAYAALGDQSLVSATYQRCIEALDRELGLDPSPQTRQLYEQILRREMSTPVTPKADTQPAFGQPPFLAAREEPPFEPPLFVAREQELSQLENHLHRAEAAQGRVVFITGEAGGGKTAMIQEFTRRAQMDRPNLLVAGGNCNAQTGIGDPYLPFREILELLSGDVEARWAAGALSGQHARRLWQALPFTVETLLDAGADLIGTFVAGGPLAARAAEYTPIDEAGTLIDGRWLDRLKQLSESSTHTSSGHGPEQRDLFEQYARVLQSLARRFLLVLVVDDLQWSDLGSIHLLFHLGRHIGRSRILILGAFRPEDVALGRDGERHPLEALVNEFRRDYGDIVVNLGQAKGEAFVEAILDSEPNKLGDPFRAMLYRQTRGQPLFTIELLRGMQERGDLVRGPDGYWLEGSVLDWHTLPARVEAVVGERIGRLDRPLRNILRVASVEGETFTAEVVAQVSGTDQRTLLASLSDELDRRHRLIRAQSIARVDGRLMSRYRFRHILFQKYLYNSMDEIEQVHLHESVGTALEALYGSQQGTIAASVQLARHFQRARIIDKAIHYLQQAGDKAIHLSAFPEAIAHLNSALTMLAELPESPERLRKELALQLSLVIAMKGSIPEPEWEEVFNRARELCQRTGNKVQWCQVSCELSISCYVRAQYQKAYELGQEALDLALECGNPLLTAICQWQMGYHLFAMGQFGAARGYLDQVLTFYDPHQHHQALVSLRGSDPGVGAMAYDACSLWCLGYPDRAMQRSQEALNLAREIGHAFSLADVVCFAGCLLARLRLDTEALSQHAELFTRMSQNAGFHSFEMIGNCYQGLALTMQGHAHEGLRLIRRGLERREAVGAWCYHSDIWGGMAEAQAMTGHVEEGLATLTEALTLVEETGERYFEAELYRIQAELHLRRDDELSAEDSLHKSIEISRRQKAKLWELRASTNLARLQARQGRRAEARSRLQGIYDWFDEGFDTPELQKAKCLLIDLS